jgi:hypothetical protein
MPPSGLIGLVRCSQRFATLLGRELICRLDSLFVIMDHCGPILRPISYRGTNFGPISEIEFVPGEFQALIGADFIYFAEASKGYDGPPSPYFFEVAECLTKSVFYRMSCRDSLTQLHIFLWGNIDNDLFAAEFRFKS